jgi:phage tail-like protein
MKKEQIKKLLPAVLQGGVQPGSPMLAILDIMELLHGPSENALANLDANFDPYRASDEFVPYLASWLDLEVLLKSPRAESESSAYTSFVDLGRLRELIAAAANLSHWRGTGKGLLLFLETATGENGFEVNEKVVGANGKAIPFHMRVVVPKSLSEQRILIERIVDLEKPAYVTREIVFAI